MISKYKAVVATFALIMSVSACTPAQNPIESTAPSAQTATPNPTVATQTPVASATSGIKGTTYTSTENKFSVQYPSVWQVTVGNAHAPILPKNTVNFQSKQSVVDVSIISEASSSADSLKTLAEKYVARTMFETPIQTKNILISGQPAIEASFSQEGQGGATYMLVSIVRINGRIYYIQTQKADAAHQTVEDQNRMNAYSQIVTSFKAL